VSGVQVMKVILLLVPVAALLLFVAARALVPSASVEGDVQRVMSLGQQLFRSPSPTTRKHSSTGKQH
jgi:hypothetical protein